MDEGALGRGRGRDVKVVNEVRGATCFGRKKAKGEWVGGLVVVVVVVVVEPREGRNPDEAVCGGMELMRAGMGAR